MTHEPFAYGNTFFHHLDPRIKWIFGIAFAFFIAIAQQGPVLGAGMLLALLCLIVSRPPLGPLFKRLLVVNVFIASLWIFLPFTTPGEALSTVFSLEPTRQGILLAAKISVKTNTIVIFLTAWLGTTTVFNLAHALSHLKVPDKLVQIFFFTWRYVHELKLELHRLRNTLKARSFRPHTDMHTYKTYAYLVGMLLVRSFERSERIYEAMLCRGFFGRFPAYHHFHLNTKDSVTLAGFGVCLLMLGYFEWMT
jgi:cobalt/nickel transport system permease protein